jgi:peptide/nickel transport system substrate-binding protein
VALLPFFLTACESAPDGTSPRVLTVGVPDDVATLDGVFASGDRSVEVIMNAYEPLMIHSWTTEGEIGRFVPGKLEGAVLESLTLAQDGVTWTLRVRPGIRFPDGGEIDAGTVFRLFERNYLVPGSGGRFVLRSIGRVLDLSSIEVTGKYELRVRTDGHNPLFARLLVLSNAIPFDPAIVDRNRTPASSWAESFLSSHTAGAGAYRLTRWTPGVEVMLDRNESYWRGEPAIERVVLKIVPSAADRMMLLSSGALDLVERMSAEEIEALSKLPGLRVLSVPSTTVVQLTMNNRIPPFDDPRVRRALAHAIPYQELIDHVYFGRARRAIGPVPLGFPGREGPIEPPYSHDPEKARRLLAEAGFPEGMAVELSLDAGSPNAETLAVFVRAALEKAGVRARLRKLTPSVFSTQRARRLLPLFLDEGFWWVDDPAYALLMGYTSEGYLNHASYSSPEVDRLVETALSLPEPDRSLQLSEAERKVLSDVPSAWILQPSFNLAMRENVSGYVHFNDHVLRFFFLRKGESPRAPN